MKALIVVGLCLFVLGGMAAILVPDAGTALGLAIFAGIGLVTAGITWIIARYRLL